MESQETKICNDFRSDEDLPLYEPCGTPNGTHFASPCDACGMRDCPTRGLVTEEMMQEASANALSPVQMVVSCVSVFLVPLFCALAGVVFWNQYKIFGLTPECGAVAGALIGFLSGMIIVQFCLKLLRFRNGS